MLGRKPTFITPDHRRISERTLTEFLNLPKSTRLTETYDFAFFAPFEIAARFKGKLISAQWMEGCSPFRAIHQLQLEAPSSDLLQLAIVTGTVPLDAHCWRDALNREKNGRFALEVLLSGMRHRVSPLETIATNRPLHRWFINWVEERRLTAQDFFALSGKLNLLSCDQFLMQCGNSANAVETYRGNRLVPSDQSTEQLAEGIIAGICRWFMANQDSEGALPYKYWPSAGTYSTEDNPIRRFMASVAFNRLSNALNREDVRVAARNNLDYNLRRFYQKKNGEGIIVWQHSVKLGSLAMAGLAIVESPFAATWKTELDELRRTVDKLWQPSGAFRTFLYPPDRNDNQNFYPGEALLFWATCLQQEPDEALLARALCSLFYYQEHFRKNPNPAFVPWHTQAATILFRLTGDTAIRDYIFEMNDWLLSHQQWGGSIDADYWGRFYTPGKPIYGPPHASATGVYLEGLVDALVLAREVADSVRNASYEQAIQRGIRSLAQLQYRDDLDAYYVSRTDRVTGAVRTESDNNEIRIDNLQHGLMALLKYRDISRRC